MRHLGPCIALWAMLSLSACTAPPALVSESLLVVPDTVSLYTSAEIIAGTDPSDEPTTGIRLPPGARVIANAYDDEYWRVELPDEYQAGRTRFFVHRDDVADNPERTRYVSLWRRAVERGSASIDPFARATGTHALASANHELHRGPRGGCYYLSGGGSKVYVARSLCDDRERVAAEPSGTRSPSYTPGGSTGGPVRVRGYTRRDGTYVRPHTRSRPRRN